MIEKLPKKELINIAGQIIKSAYMNKGKILKDNVDLFYQIPQSIRFEAQRYVNQGLI
jgi:hypothetical protein